VSGIGALKGPLHGGANEQVMLMVEKIKDPARADAWIRKALTDKARIMGFGTACTGWKTAAKHLKRLALELGQQVGDTSKVEILDTMVRVSGARSTSSRTWISTRARPMRRWGSRPTSSRRSSP